MICLKILDSFNEGRLHAQRGSRHALPTLLTMHATSDFMSGQH
jgi:hypothetical protein